MSVEKILITPEDIRNAVIDGMLCRAEEKGERKGKRKIILALLESMDIEEVSRVTKMSVENIKDLRDNK